MPAQSRLRQAAYFAAVIVLSALCSGGTLADSAAPFRLAALEPSDLPLGLSVPPAALAPAPPLPQGPFGLSNTESGQFSERWRTLQPLLQVEAQILTRCRANPAECPAPAARFLGIIQAAQARDGRARIGDINRAINLAIRPVSDPVQYGVPDLWASPLMTFSSGAGDCDDYAIAKYVALREAGIATADLRLVIVHDNKTNDGHMVAAVRVDGQWLILNNLTMRLLTDSEEPDFAPIAALGGDGGGPSLAATPETQPAAPPAQAWNTAGLAIAL